VCHTLLLATHVSFSRNCRIVEVYIKIIKCYIVCVVGVWFKQPHLAPVRPFGLGLGEAAHLWCFDCSQVKPAITTHTHALKAEC